MFAVNHAALYSFHGADHGERDDSSLRSYAHRCASEHGISLTGGRGLLLCDPRLLGYSFDPLSVYFCHRADGARALIIHEVRNTSGEIHSYVLPVRPGGSGSKREAGAETSCRRREDRQYLLGERKKPRLYYISAIRPRGRALVW